MNDLSRTALNASLNVVDSFEGKNVTIMRGHSAHVLRLLNEGSFDFVYVDGSHYYSDVKADIGLAKRLVRDGGILCGDDLERDPYPFLVEYARECLDQDCVTLEGGGYFHPGVMLAVHEEVGDVSNFSGFWACRKDGDVFVPIEIGGISSDIPTSERPDGLPAFYAARPGDPDFPAGFPRVTASSELSANFAANYMMSPRTGIWHARAPVIFPEGIIFEFDAPLTVRQLWIRAQEAHPERAPTDFELLVLNDESWQSVLHVQNYNWSGNEWTAWPLPEPASADIFMLRMNAGKTNMLTLGNVYLSPK